MDRLTCMEAFVRVADAPGFAEAARRWGRSKAVVSKYVAHLEQQLGVALFQRSTRAVSLTEAGQTHYDSCRELLELLRVSEERLKSEHAAPQGPLRVSAPPGFFTGSRSDVLASFLRAYPEVRLRLAVTNRLTDLVDERIDVAVRVTKPEDSSLIARRIAPLHMAVVASPAYLGARGMPDTVHDLAEHDGIVDESVSFRSRWPFRTADGPTVVEVRGHANTNDPFTGADLALAGLGVALLPFMLVAPMVQQGRLVELFPDQFDASASVYAVTSQREHLPASARTFIDHLKRELPPILGRAAS